MTFLGTKWHNEAKSFHKFLCIFGTNLTEIGKTDIKDILLKGKIKGPKSLYIYNKRTSKKYSGEFCTKDEFTLLMYFYP